MHKNNNNSNKSGDGKEDLTELTKSLKVMKSFYRLTSLLSLRNWALSWFMLLMTCGFAEQDKGVEKAEEDAGES